MARTAPKGAGANAAGGVALRADDIRALRGAAPDSQKARALEDRIRALKATRRPFFLTAGELDEILHWKLRDQYGRQEVVRGANTDAVVRAVTGAALNIVAEDEDYEVELRIGLLCALRGVGVPVASAILAMAYPERYAVIDFRAWRQLFGKKRSAFGIAEYRRLLALVRPLARELGWSVRETDEAIWALDQSGEEG